MIFGLSYNCKLEPVGVVASLISRVVILFFLYVGNEGIDRASKDAVHISSCDSHTRSLICIPDP